MKASIKTYEPMCNDIDIAEGPDNYSLPIEEFLDRNFGRGTWVLDAYNDKFVVCDMSRRGPEKAYIIIDRDFRRFTATVPATCIN